MHLLNPTMWALWFACLLLLIAAVINARTLTVPNRLSLPALLVGWLVAVVVSASTDIPSHGGGFPPSLAATVIGLLLLVPFYVSGWLGAGCVKVQMAFGAWVGCALDLPAAVWVTGFATVLGGLLTTIAAGVIIATQRSRTDEQSVDQPRMFPAQITLSMGSICGVVAAGLLGWI
jgi:Flp pilus assembly protein protease CpaA